MSLTISVYGIKPPDERWWQMKAVYDACCAANLALPEAVSTYFEYGDPDPKGVVVTIPYEEGQTDDSDTYDVELTTLSPDIKIIRFALS